MKLNNELVGKTVRRTKANASGDRSYMETTLDVLAVDGGVDGGVLHVKTMYKVPHRIDLKNFDDENWEIVGNAFNVEFGGNVFTLGTKVSYIDNNQQRQSGELVSFRDKNICRTECSVMCVNGIKRHCDLKDLSLIKTIKAYCYKAKGAFIWHENDSEDYIRVPLLDFEREL